MMNKKIILITGTSRGIGRALVDYYITLGHQVIGCSRNEIDLSYKNYKHFTLDISDEKPVRKLFVKIKKN